MNEPIALDCILNKVTTLVDGGWRVAFDCQVNAGEQLVNLVKMRHERLYLVVMTAEQMALSLE